MRNLKLRKINQPNIYIALALPDLQFYDLPIANVSNWAKWYAQWVEINSEIFLVDLSFHKVSFMS